MLSRTLRSLTILFTFAWLAACGGGGGYGGGGGGTPQNQTITFAQAGPLSGAVGTSISNTASGGAGTGAISYSSSNAAVASVNTTTGSVQLLTVGTSTITASKAASSGYNAATANYTINVTAGSQTIAFAQAGPLDVAFGSTTTNVASGGGGTGAVTYASSNTNAVSVDSVGAARAVGVGTAIITATKAADANYTSAQATYTINSQPATSVNAFVGANSAEVYLPASANGKQFGRARIADCAPTDTVVTCPNAQLSAVTTAATTDTRATLSSPAYYAIVNGATVGTPVEVATTRFSQRIGHAVVYFKNRYWLIGGSEPVFTGTSTITYASKADVWSSPDGATWKRETADGGFGDRWFHQAVVFNGRIWIISGATSPDPVPPGATFPWYSDVWSSADGVTWTRETTDAQLPWWSDTIKVVVFNGEMLLVSGGRTYASTTGVFTQKSTVNPALTNTLMGRSGATLTIYNNQLWYIGGKPELPINPPPPPTGSGMNDVWRSSDGVSWTQVTGAAPFGGRYFHSSFVANNKLWVFGGRTVTNGVPGSALGDAWSTTDGVSWTNESTSGLASNYLARVVQEAGRVTMIAGVQVGVSNHVWQSTNGTNWSHASSAAQFSPRLTKGIEFNGEMWVVAGLIHDGSVVGHDSNQIWRSQDGLNWSLVTPNGAIFSPRAGVGLAVHINRLWVIGGWNNSGGPGAKTRFNDVWSSSDGVTWRQETAAAAFEARVGHSVFSSAGRLWVVAGSISSGDVNDVWSSTDGIAWTQVTAAAAFSPRSAAASVTFNNEMWVIGGGTASSTNDIWHSADGVQWTQFNTAGALFSPRTRHAAEVLNGRVYVVGGASSDDYNSGVRYNDVWSSADGTNWRQETASANFSPRSLHALIKRGNELWVVGGFDADSLNDVWRSADGVNWRLGFRHEIESP